MKAILLLLPLFAAAQRLGNGLPGICERPTNADRPPALTPLEQTSRGPQFPGTIVVAGGALRDRSVFEHILELGGGTDADIVFVPTNNGNSYDTPESIEAALEGFRALSGWQVNKISLVHTNDPAVANTTEFIRPIQEANIAWFGGGRQWRMADSYLYTRAEEEFRAILERGGVVAGSSAGASIMGDVMVRGHTGGNAMVVGDHLQGFSYVTNIGFDQHFLQRNRHNDMVEFVTFFPYVLGLSIDENTAIEMNGDVFTVLGQSLVAIHDRTVWPTKTWCSNGLSFIGRPILTNDQKIFYLSPGDTYNVRTRQVVSLRERVSTESWF